jgi:sugar phosphate isomerase/epimerase
MRLRHPNGRIVHLGYEIAPRPARRVADVVAQLDTYAAVRTMIGADSLGVSLWLPPALAAALATGARIRTRLRAELDARRLEVVTLSGLSFDEETGSPFTEGGGERESDESAQPVTEPAPPVTEPAPPVTEPAEPVAESAGSSDQPLEPDPGWDDPRRREYTLDLARVLVDLLPEDTVRGVVGTIGLARAGQWSEETAKTGAGIVRRLSGGLADIAWQTGRAVRVGFQTTSGYVLDSPAETVAALARIDKDRLGVRLDLEHVIRTWDDPVGGLETLTDAGLSIIEVRVTASPGPRLDAWRGLLAALLGPDGPQTDYLTVAGHVDEPSAEQVASDLAYLRAELAALGLAPENEPCAAR